jgi:peptide/nickel transport system permease protein
MPEPSPSSSRLLEPSGAAYEALTITHEDDQVRARADLEAGGTGYVPKRLGILFWIAVGWFALVAGLAVIAPYITTPPTFGDGPGAGTSKVEWLQNPDVQNTNRRVPGGGTYQQPSKYHWLGTDESGRDELSRLIWGARVSLPVGFTSIGLGLIVGATVGLLAGYRKGAVDGVLMSAMDVILAFPALLLAMAIVTFTGAYDILHISLAIGVVSIPAIARLVRANTLTFREREFVLASRTLGASHGRVLTREILPNVIPPVLSFAIIGVAVAIAAEAALAFVGVSVPIPAATWGGMIRIASSDLNQHPFQVFVPCLVLVLTIMSLYLIGDSLTQRFDGGTSRS